LMHDSKTLIKYERERGDLFQQVEVKQIAHVDSVRFGKVNGIRTRVEDTSPFMKIHVIGMKNSVG
jgi:hypothetical protein